VLLAEEFAELFDGFSIGSNDLTQLTLGVDRDSELLARIFDERDPGVKRFIRMVVEAAHRKGAKVGLCGQAPSDYPEFAQFLVEAGIDSISVTPDAFARVVRRVAGGGSE
jgi:pyruvate,water dikinase